MNIRAGKTLETSWCRSRGPGHETSALGSPASASAPVLLLHLAHLKRLHVTLPHLPLQGRILSLYPPTPAGCPGPLRLNWVSIPGLHVSCASHGSTYCSVLGPMGLSPTWTMWSLW